MSTGAVRYSLNELVSLKLVKKIIREEKKKEESNEETESKDKDENEEKDKEKFEDRRSDSYKLSDKYVDVIEKLTTRIRVEDIRDKETNDQQLTLKDKEYIPYTNPCPQSSNEVVSGSSSPKIGPHPSTS
jgi:hypothetical protein